MLNKSILSLVLASLSAAAAVPAMAKDSMAVGQNGYMVSPPLMTVGESLYNTSGALNDNTKGTYTPVGIFDGMGAYAKDEDTVRVFVNHELLNFRGNEYEVNDGQGGSFSLKGARISYFDIDKYSKDIVDGGIAYDTIYDANGDLATDAGFLSLDFAGFSRFCSGSLVEAGAFNDDDSWRKRGRYYYDGGNHGLEDDIFFAGEEDGGGFNPIGGAEWALDVANGDLWQVPAMGRGAWENIVAVDTGDAGTVAFILADDSSPFDFDKDGEVEAAPLYLYIGQKQPGGNFLQRNGLSNGQLYVWVARNGARTPLDFRGTGSRLKGDWLAIDNRQNLAQASADGASGYDKFGYPTQSNLIRQAEALGAFGFSRPEDVAYNPQRPNEIVLASTGVDTYAVDPNTGNGADSFGTLYKIRTNFRKMTSGVKILYDGDDDPRRALRSPDNLDWADDGYIYVQEDEAEEDTLSGEPLFGSDAINPNEAGIVRVNPRNGRTLRVANIDREVVIDASVDELDNPAFDVDAGAAGEWESSGIVDVSTLFDKPAGSLLLFNVQAHGIEDQSTKGDNPNADSRINDDDLVEGGQILFLYKLQDDDYYHYYNQ